MISRILSSFDRTMDRLEGVKPSERSYAEEAAGSAEEAPSDKGAKVFERPGTPLFTILAGVFLFVCLSSPLIMLTMPVMLTLGMAVTAMVRRERPRWIAPTVAVLSIIVVISASAQLDSIRSSFKGDAPSSIAAATLVDWNWTTDPGFGGGRGTIKWTAAVRNTSERPMSLVKVELTTYDENRRILSSDFTYLNAIAPGATRTSQSYADFYGNEVSANAQVAEVYFSGD